MRLRAAIEAVEEVTGFPEQVRDRCRRGRGHLLLLLMLQHLPVAHAHLPEDYGRKFVRAEQAVAVPGEEATSVASGQDIDQQERQLAAAGRGLGPYADGLADPLITLAALHRGRDELDEAADYYRRALHLVRVNDGLYSERQVPIVRELMGIYRRQGDLGSLGDIYQYYGRVLKLHKHDRHTVPIDLALEYLRWERELYVTRADGLQRMHLARAYRTNRVLLESFAAPAADERESYFRLALSQMRNFYLILGDQPLSAVPGNQVSADPLAAKAEREIASRQQLAFSEGIRLLRECIELARDADAHTRARLELELGDWYQWNDELRRARTHYLAVVALLREAGEEALLTQWLDQPMELPDEENHWVVEQMQAVDPGAVVEASYSVTAQGIARGIEVSVGDDAYDEQAWRIKRMLREAHFRPRYDSEGPQPAEGVTRRYRLVTR
jgi:hypothetical protein